MTDINNTYNDEKNTSKRSNNDNNNVDNDTVGSKNSRSGYYNRKNKNNRQKFSGKCEALKNYVFDAGKFNQADNYIKTVNEIAEYVGSNYECGADVREAIESGIVPTFDKPQQPHVDDQGIMDLTDQKIWEKEIEFYVKRKQLLTFTYKYMHLCISNQVCVFPMHSCTQAMDSLLRLT